MRPAYPIMFHHFYNEQFPSGEGAINADDLRLIIEKTGPENILPARDWLNKWEAGTLEENEICLTFDDNLQCQYQIAYPVLKEYSLTGFWFIYTSPFEGTVEKLEVYKHFRTTRFANIDAFYDAFFSFVAKSEFFDIVSIGIDSFPENYLSEGPFYSRRDKVFRYLRDKVLESEKYIRLMDKFLESENFDVNASKNLWMTSEEIKEIHSNGNVIGLHSHTHPTSIVSLGYKGQQQEYSKNFDILSGIINEKPFSASFPCGSYNSDSLDILKKLGVRIAFRREHYTPGKLTLEFPRIDHALVMAQINQ